MYLGKTPKKQKEKILSQISNGEIDIVIGTHSLLEEKVKFKNLSLIVIDEQHKFGVLQRKKLYDKSQLPDVLIMTATPIPRSLAMTLYAELDISVIDELPKGRKPIKTLFFKEEKEAFNFVIEKLYQGEKVYIVYPVIEENKLELKSLITEYNKLTSTIFRNFHCGMLHGKLKPEEKNKQMLKFKSGEFKVLFSTTVVEVGIDVTDATVILINHSERFGLSTLHQLRGRVGRGEKESYCILTGKLSTEQAKQRIETMLSTNDGFVIAQRDLELRGAGEIFGTQQHGLSEIDYSDVLKYPDLLKKAREYAKNIIVSNNYNYEHKFNYNTQGKKIQLGNIG